MSHLIIVEQLKDWHSQYPSVNLVTAKDYLAQSDQFRGKGIHLINLCRSYRYLKSGYYCSLLAEARHHRIIPNIRTITDLSKKSIYQLNIDDLDNLIQRVLDKYQSDQEQKILSVNIFFGQSEDKELRGLAQQLFEIFRAPLLTVEFRKIQRWSIHKIKPLHLNQLSATQQTFFASSLNTYLGSRWRSPRAKIVARYDLAILYNPDEKMPPSNMTALKRFIQEGKRLDVAVDLITRKDYNRLAEYDALFIRETTAINHYTYRFSKKAETEGMVVIDNPDSIVKCTNKVYLAELLNNHHIPSPRSMIIRKENAMQTIGSIGYPVVLKIPDGSFSRGVYKANTSQETTSICEKLFKQSDLILAQEFLYTDFDWRIGVLNQQPIYACQYHMSRSHWQIVKHGPDGKSHSGNHLTVSLEQVPSNVLQTAIKAANLIGNSLYGVDIKESNGSVYVIEVNDNPNIDAGVEDQVLGNTLYRTIISDFINRIEQRSTH
jgi:glutathione synthase/RimK-type ligase-like ATP-grasp enzyme